MPLGPQEAVDFISLYENDAAAFQEDILGRNLNTHLWSTPKDICDAISKPHAQVAVKACHGSSKTFLAGGFVIWWVAMGGIAITTAPTDQQVRRLLWGEVHAAYRRSKIPVGGILNQKELRITEDNYALGFSTDETVNFQGFHGKVLIILDEATGIEQGIWEAIHGIRSGGDVRVLALGNPTDMACEFARCFTEKSAAWDCFTISAFDTPNLLGVSEDEIESRGEAHDLDFLNDNIIPYLPTRRWVYESMLEWGRNSPVYNSRVLGQFPMQSSSALLSLAWLERARDESYVDEALPKDVIAGVDVAGPGEDETVVAVRRGPQLIDLIRFTEDDPRYEVANALEPYRDDLVKVNVDVIGIGYNFARYLEDQQYPVVDVNVAERSDDPEKFFNKKAQFYWSLRQRLQDGDCTNLPAEAVPQLSSIHYEERRGQIKIESKEDAKKKRGIKSPDIAEATMLCYAETEHQSYAWAAPRSAHGGFNQPHRSRKGKEYY